MERNVPKLRFKGFNDEWKIDKLNENTYIKGRIGWKNLKQEEYTLKGPYLIAGKHINEGIINWDKCDHISEERYEESMEIALKDDDIIFSKDGSIGNPALIQNLKVKATINGTMMLIRLDQNEYEPSYFYQILKSEYFEKLIRNVKSGSSIPHIFQRDMIEFKFPVPGTLQEQKRIANFLTKVDKIIEKQDEKVKNLEKYKKGMMQKIFSQEIRFKDENGEEYPEWEYKRFGDITKKTGERNKENKEYKVYSISNKYGFIPQEEQFEESRLDSLDKSAYKIVYAGDFAYNPARINVGSIGLLDSGEGIVSSLYVCFRLTEEMNNEFYKNYFSTFTFNKDVIRSVEGGVREYLFYDNFIRIKAPVPCFREQNKIAEFLDIISKTLNKEAEKLNELKKWKKGLLQQMFV